MRADAEESDLARLLGDLLGFQQSVGKILGLVFQMQVPDVDIIHAQFLEAGIDVLQRLFLRL